MQRTGEVNVVTKRAKPAAGLIAPPAESTEPVFGRQEGSMTILGDIVHAEDVHAGGIQEMEQERDELLGRPAAGESSPPQDQ
ncbi:MAG TPA: hypothetical protein VGK29_26490 [Paludibaculum sp.]|jgi:hypothetical protein